MMVGPLAMVIGLLGPVGLIASARADYSLSFDQANYTVGVGQVFDVRVFLVETPGTSVLQTDGLFGAGMDLNYNLPPAVSDPAQVTSVSPPIGLDPTANLFTSITPSIGSNAGVATLIWDNGIGPILFPSNGSNEILVGTFEFTAGLTAGQVTNLSLDIPTTLGGQFVTGVGDVLDASISVGTATITVGRSVPEPSSLILVVCGLICVCSYGWRSASKRQTTEAGMIGAKLGLLLA
jgi:hypothetical protein